MFLNCKCPIYQIHDDKGLPNDDKRLGEEDDDVVASMLFIIGNHTIKIWAKTNSKYDGSVE